MELFDALFVIDSNGNSATIIWMMASIFQLRVPFTMELFDAMFVIDSNGILQLLYG